MNAIYFLITFSIVAIVFMTIVLRKRSKEYDKIAEEILAKHPINKPCTFTLKKDLNIISGIDSSNLYLKAGEYVGVISGIYAHQSIITVKYFITDRLYVELNLDYNDLHENTVEADGNKI